MSHPMRSEARDAEAPETGAVPDRPPSQPARGRDASRTWTKKRLAASLGVGCLVLAASRIVESRLIAALQAEGHALEWVSDVGEALAVSTVTYLWLHLRAARSRVLDLERAQIVLDEQIRLAAEIQRNLLPPVPAETPGYRWHARMVPAYEVGGDFYDFLPAPDGTVMAIVGDVAGKGVPAALLQSSLKTLFRVHCRASSDPATIAGLMSAALIAETGGLPYATAILARFEPDPPGVVYANAGHPAGVVVRGNEVFRLDRGGPPLGILPAANYVAGALDLRQGDVGVFVTDGITEALDAVDRSLDEVIRETGDPSPGAICDRLLRIGGAAHPPEPDAERLQDDRTLLAFRVETSGGGFRAGGHARGGSTRVDL